MASPSSPCWEGRGSVGSLGSSTCSSTSTSTSGGYNSDGIVARSGSLEAPGSILSSSSDHSRFSGTSLSRWAEAPIYPSIDCEGFEDVVIDTRGGIKAWERHVFLCFKDPLHWPSSPLEPCFISDRLPRALVTAIKLRRDEMVTKTRVILCEGRDGTESSNGDVMIFPDMVRYRGLTHFDVDAFVEEVLVHNGEWLPGKPERLHGTHIFVCIHGNPSWASIIQATQEHISRKDLAASVNVKPCFYLEGYNKYLMSLITYGHNASGEVLGHCYGSVTPGNVPNVLDDLQEKGYLLSGYRHPEIVEYKKQPTVRTPLDTSLSAGKRADKQCLPGKPGSHVNCPLKRSSDAKERFYTRVRWYFWEREDTMVTLAVMAAVASVAIATCLHQRHSLH